MEVKESKQMRVIMKILLMTIHMTMALEDRDNREFIEKETAKRRKKFMLEQLHFFENKFQAHIINIEKTLKLALSIYYQKSKLINC